MYDENKTYNKREMVSYACCLKIVAVRKYISAMKNHHIRKLKHENKVYDTGKKCLELVHNLPMFKPRY
jgi:hypothetical protein